MCCWSTIIYHNYLTRPKLPSTEDILISSLRGAINLVFHLLVDNLKYFLECSVHPYKPHVGSTTHIENTYFFRIFAYAHKACTLRPIFNFYNSKRQSLVIQVLLQLWGTSLRTCTLLIVFRNSVASLLMHYFKNRVRVQSYTLANRVVTSI